MYSISGSFIVRFYAYIMMVTMFCAIVVSREATLWPWALSSTFPSRPVYQIGVACSLGPYLIYLTLWMLKVKSRNIKMAAFFKFILIILKSFISANDDTNTHGVLEYSYAVAVSYWMLAISWKGRKSSVLYENKKRIGFREAHFIAYVASFLYSLHTLSRYFRTGSGFGVFKNLQALQMALDISFDYLNAGEFPGIVINCSWAHLHNA